MGNPMRLPIIAAVAALALAGCASAPSAPPPLTPMARYALQVEPGLDRIALAVHDSGLSANQQAALAGLAQRYAATGAGPVRVEAPAGDDPAAAAQAYAVRAALEAEGVPAQAIRIAAYAAPDPRAPVLAGFETVQARITDCAGRQGDLGGRFSNQASAGFGCAINANMAAQIDDPRDINGPRPMSPGDSSRAAVVFSNYRTGAITSATQEPLVGGRVAQAVD